MTTSEITTYFKSDQDLVSITNDQIETLVKVFAESMQIEFDEVSIHFVNKAKITSLHGIYFQDETPTDCISFPIDSIHDNVYPKVIGEVFVCPEVALEYSKEHDISFESELTLYVIHGLLHLIGYDDIEETDRQIMREKEAYVMKSLQSANALLLPLFSL